MADTHKVTKTKVVQQWSSNSLRNMERSMPDATINMTALS